MNVTAGIICGVCGSVYHAVPGVSHSCGPARLGHATSTPDPIDYERIRKIIREEIARALIEKGAGDAE